jgi:hypothetical protein
MEVGVYERRASSLAFTAAKQKEAEVGGYDSQLTNQCQWLNEANGAESKLAANMQDQTNHSVELLQHEPNSVKDFHPLQGPLANRAI